MKTQPTALPTQPQTMPSAVPTLTDWHTWAALLTSMGALVAVIFHKNLSVYVPLVSIAAAGLTNIFLMITKHNYASALATAGSTLSAGAAVAPAGVVGEINKASEIMTAVQHIQATAAPIETAFQNTVAPSTSRAQTPPVA